MEIFSPYSDKLAERQQEAKRQAIENKAVIVFFWLFSVWFAFMIGEAVGSGAYNWLK
jgi:hypothetical protein